MSARQAAFLILAMMLGSFSVLMCIVALAPKGPTYEKRVSIRDIRIDNSFDYKVTERVFVFNTETDSLVAERNETTIVDRSDDD